jgi:cytoskeletal protein CcmA (bactofilin family)
MVWKREEPLRPTNVPTSSAQTPMSDAQEPAQSVPATAPSVQEPVKPFQGSSLGFDQPPGGKRSMNEELASIGKSIVINGELTGSEDLTIEGRVEGKIDLKDHVLTVGLNGRIKAQVTAKSIVVFGHVMGNLAATEKVDIKEKGSVEGDIVSPRVAIADGSHFKGSVDMQRKEGSNGDRVLSTPISDLVRV